MPAAWFWLVEALQVTHEAPLPGCGWFTTSVPLLSSAYMRQPRASWRRLLMHLMALARSLAAFKAGRSRAAKIAMMAMTTSNSINVKAHIGRIRWVAAEFIGQALLYPAPGPCELCV